MNDAATSTATSSFFIALPLWCFPKARDREIAAAQRRGGGSFRPIQKARADFPARAQSLR
jgi:hypothetical protein